MDRSLDWMVSHTRHMLPVWATTFLLISLFFFFGWNGLWGNIQERLQVCLFLLKSLKRTCFFLCISCIGTPSLVVQSLIGLQKTWHFQLHDSYRMVVLSLIIIWLVKHPFWQRIYVNMFYLYFEKNKSCVYVIHICVYFLSISSTMEEQILDERLVVLSLQLAMIMMLL